MDMENATKTQLLTICLYEDCPLSVKYDALRELDMRKWDSHNLSKLIRLWGIGKSVYELVDIFGVEYGEIANQLKKYRLYGRRIGARKNDGKSPILASEV